MSRHRRKKIDRRVRQTRRAIERDAGRGNGDHELHDTHESLRDEQRRALYEPREGEPSVTDHAVVRYLERVVGLDIDALRQAIWSERIAQAAELLGQCSIQHDDGYRVVLADGVVVTVLGDGRG